MLRQRPSHPALLLASLALSLSLGAGSTRPASCASADTARASLAGPASVTVAPQFALQRQPSAALDSARRAYRAWRRSLRARALADSLARADSLACADSLARADSLVRAAAVPPPGDYVAEVRANFTPQNRAYATTRAALGFLEPLYGILLGFFILFSGLSAWMRDLARSLSRRSYVQVLVYLTLYLALGFVLEFPLVFFQGFALERQYGLLNQSFGPWMLDQVKGLLVSLIFFGVVPLVWFAYQPIRRFPRHWWLVLGVGTLPVILAGAFLQPLVVDPLFNRFTSLADKRLEAQILEVADRAGIPARHVFQMDASRQSNRYNAYVSGFGVSQRIVLWDTTLKGMKPDEIVFVVGHEAAHYRLHHMWWGILFATGLSFLLFWLSAGFMRRAVACWGRRWGFTELHDIASLPLFVVALTLFSFLAQPGMNAYSRRLEHDSDTFGLELTRTNDAAARAFMKLGSQNRSDPEPSPFIEFFQYGHPPLLERVRYALSYRPWQEGKPNRLYQRKS
jgi:Zn-dependent protease with chaperone function